MKVEELQKLLEKPIGKKMVFRREVIVNPVAPEGTEQQLWDQLVTGQWYSMVRDILALSNGNLKTTQKTGWLIIGMDPAVGEDGAPKYYDTSQITLYEEQILEKLNLFSEPPLQDLELQRLEMDGNQLIVITVPKSPFLHETSKQLQLSNGVFDENSGLLTAVEPGEVYPTRTVFVRRVEGITAASETERRNLIEEKSIQSGYKRLVKRIKDNPVFSILSFLLITALPTFWFLYNEVLPSFQPEVMGGEFNVAVAEMTVVDEDGKTIRSQDGEAVSEFLYTRLDAGFDELNLEDIRYEVWGPEQTDKVKGDTPEARSQAAQALAEDINAHVIVYGVITTGDSARFSPEFFVDYKGFEQVEDITGDHEMGSAMRISLPFELTQMQVIENPALSARANALSLITIGLAFLSVDDAEKALDYFQQAEALDGWFKTAGKEIIYLLIGNAFGRQASIQKSETYLASARENYTTALDIDPTYGRAKIGQAAVLYLISLGDPYDASFESIDLEMLDQAEALFQEASKMEGSPESSNVQTKSALGLGQVYFVKSQILGEDWIKRANDEFKKVIEDYESGDERIGETASHAYARIGLIAWLNGDLESAVEFYVKAIEAASPYYQGYYFASLGDIYMAAGRMDEARDAYTEAIRIAEFYGDEESATRYVERLKSTE